LHGTVFAMILHFLKLREKQILRFAQDDKYF